MREITFFIIIISLIGCSSQKNSTDQKDIDNGKVRIYSTHNFVVAQQRADVMCGAHAYYLDLEHESNKKLVKLNSVNKVIYDYIPFNCDLFDAAKSGSIEAKPIAKEQLKLMYNDLDKAKETQYGVHKSYAEKHGGDSYSIVNPDGSIEAHSIDSSGVACHSTVSIAGGQTYCD